MYLKQSWTALIPCEGYPVPGNQLEKGARAESMKGNDAVRRLSCQEYVSGRKPIDLVRTTLFFFCKEGTLRSLSRPFNNLT